MSAQYFINNGLKLGYTHNYVKKSKIGVIIIHGLAEHKGRYTDFISDLNNAGISVFAIDLRGHGESGGRRGDVNCFDNYIDDLDFFVKYIKNKYQDLKLTLFGHSIGGLIASAYAAKTNLIDLLILSSPSFETPKAINVLSYIPNTLLHKIYIKKRHSESAEMLEYSRNDPHACNRITLGLLKYVFIDGIKFTTENFENISVPILMLGGRFDNLVNSGKLEYMLSHFNCTDKTIIIYENAKHRIVQNDAKDKAIPDIINWLNARI